MIADPQWFGNDVAVIAAAVSGAALAVAALSAWFSKQQVNAAQRQAIAAEHALRLQAEALKASAEDTTKALAIARENSEAAKISAQALTSQAEDTRQALEVARQNATAAVRLAEVNETLVVASQRGWLVIVDAVGSTNQGQSSITMRADFTLKNVGKVPITGAHIRHCEKILSGEPKDFAGLKATLIPTLAPGDEHILRSAIECALEEFSAIKGGENIAYFYGNAFYQDVFGAYTTYWRWEFNGNELAPSPNGNKLE
jgi:hypothetical protein